MCFVIVIIFVVIVIVVVDPMVVVLSVVRSLGGQSVALRLLKVARHPLLLSLLSFRVSVIFS